MTPPDDLDALGQRLDEVQRRHDAGTTRAPPTPLGIALRFATEMVAALAVGGGLGWLLDRWFHTRPVFIVVMFVLGAAAGIRNVVRAAQRINAEIAAEPDAPAVRDDEES